MGVAAYNRGTASLRRQIEADFPRAATPNEAMLYELNKIPKGSATLFQPTVIRWDEHRKIWWLMNRPDAGWAEHGRPYETLREIACLYALEFIEFLRDRHSAFISVRPASANTR